MCRHWQRLKLFDKQTLAFVGIKQQTTWRQELLSNVKPCFESTAVVLSKRNVPLNATAHLAVLDFGGGWVYICTPYWLAGSALMRSSSSTIRVENMSCAHLLSIIVREVSLFSARRKLSPIGWILKFSCSRNHDNKSDLMKATLADD